MARRQHQQALHDEWGERRSRDVMHDTRRHQDGVAGLDPVLHAVHGDDTEAVQDEELLHGAAVIVLPALGALLVRRDAQPDEVAAGEVLVVDELGDTCTAPDRHRFEADSCTDDRRRWTSRKHLRLPLTSRFFGQK